MRKTLMAGVAAAFAATVMTASGTAVAADFPRKPIELVIPFAQGGGTDRVGRMFADHAGKYLGQKVFVTNRTGGSGAVGFSQGANARPDGHVLTMAVTTLAVAPSTVAGYPVTYKSFAPVCLLAALPMIISVRMDSPYKTVEDLIAAAKKEGGKFKIGTAGAATNNYLAGVAFAKKAGMEPTFVPYKGAGPALVALLGGHVDAAMSDASEGLPYVEGKQTRALVVFSDQPEAKLPGVPTSSGKPYDVNIASFRGIAAPKGTPEKVMAKLVDACVKTAKDPGFVEQMNKFGMDVTLITGKEFGDWLRKQHETYAAAAKAADMAVN